MGSPRHAAARPQPRPVLRLTPGRMVVPRGAVPLAAVPLAAVVVLVLAAAVALPMVSARGAGVAPTQLPAPRSLAVAAATPSPSQPAPDPLVAPPGVDWQADAAIRAAVIEQDAADRQSRRAAMAAARRTARVTAGQVAAGRTADLALAPPADTGSVTSSAWVVGDSIAAGLGQQWPGPVHVLAFPGARSETVVPVVVDALRRGGAPSLLVVALGTNDDPRTPQAFRTQVQELVAAAPRCVVWATVHRPGGRWESFNEILRQEAARSGGRVRLADWDAFASSHPALLQSDGIHPRTGTVYRSLAALVTQAAAGCS